MDGSADPEAPPPPPTSPPSPSPSSTDAKRLRRCVQSKLSWGPAKSCGGGGGRAGGGGGAVDLSPTVAEEAAEEEDRMEAKKRKKRGRPRKSEAGMKSPLNKETTALDSSSKDEVSLVDESPHKKQQKGRNQAAALKVPNRKRCKALDYTDGYLKFTSSSPKPVVHHLVACDNGHGSCQQLHNSHAEAIVHEASPISVNTDLMSMPSEPGQVNDKVCVVNDQDTQLLVDLRSEAKIAAEENRRLSSGKKLHPFFAPRKVNKGAGQDVIIIEDTLYAFDRDLPSCPFHVLYQLEANMPVHWSNWVISERSSLDMNASDPLQNSLSFFEGLVKPLTIETNCKRMHLDQLAELNFADIAETTLPSFSDEQSESNFSSFDVIHLDDERMLASNPSFCASLFDIKHQEVMLNGRPEVAQKGCQEGCYLWTDKYRPESASEVCGNSEHVKFLSEWLKGWDERGHKNKHIGVANGNDCLYQDESDVDYSDDTSNCENVLLITGPVGCGKSAAIFACAKEQGFNVIEVNTSDMRNGAYVRQKFEEATKSHGLEKWSQDEIVNPPREDFLDLALSTPDNTEYKQSMPCSPRITHLDEQKTPANCYLSLKVSAEAPKQVINKTLILFEDVDTVFDEDRGFISTILKMSETTKWPIILTSNKKDPALPHLLDQLVLNFKYPSSAELLSHVGMICKCEGVDITVPRLKHIITICLGDIRRTTMLLQFWCQGKRRYTDRLNKCLCGTFLFDLDAAHSTMTKMLPWEFPCKLSETVCKEIDQTILMAEENKKQMEVSELEVLKSQVTIGSLTKGRSTAEAIKTKKSKLKRCHSVDCKEISPCRNDLDDFHDVPDIPLPSDQERMRNRHGLVLLSESDDDPADECTPEEIRHTGPEGGRFFPESSGLPDLQGQETLSHFRVPSESRETFEITNSSQNQLESNMARSTSQICDTFMSQDVSCVLESSFVVGSTPNTISNDDFLSRVVFSKDLSIFPNDGVHTMHTMAVEDTNNMKIFMAEPHKFMEDVVGETCDAYVESVCRNEQASCSTSGYQLMDECSRAESIWLHSGKKTKNSSKVEHVQDTWNRLRSHCLELTCGTNHNRTSSGALKLASGVSELISESDIMLTRCYPLINDILDPSSTPCVEPDDFSWYDKQLEMGSIYAQHALCIFSNKSHDICDHSVDLAQELLSASTTAISLGKLINLGINTNDGSGNILQVKNSTTYISMRREQQVHLYETMLPIIPAKLSLSLGGPAFVDYLSSMSQISRLENSWLSKSKAINRQRRSRESKHYLSSGAFSLLPQDIELLAQSSCFNDRSHKVIEETIA